jgi:hypothetical protein
LNTEVLPAPLGPMMANTSPCATSKLTSRTARTPPKDRLNWLTSKKRHQPRSDRM